MACAILDMERDTLMLSGFGSNEILKVRPRSLLVITFPLPILTCADGTQQLEVNFVEAGTVPVATVLFSSRYSK